ncbi:FAD:protein FMN transferase [Phocaeicola abscessus]|uniref:FAD:protein FMN transferase n=1 Tax=Phocaeicola abscessus TaxID=555313 RepID=UPI0028EA13E3|nr:FAD:protein FMN transferase [Phocaeicola abscessus]
MNTTNSYIDYHESSLLFHGLLTNIMWTRLEALLLGKSKEASATCWNAIVDECVRLSRIYDKFDQVSELYAVNHRAAEAPYPVGDELWSILTACREHHRLTEGYFDVALGKFKAISFDEEHRTVSFKTDQVEIDLGAYGKGYALERIRQLLIAHGFTSALINFGNSSVLGLGTHPYGHCWAVGIENPYDVRQRLDVVELRDRAMSTSGNMPAHPKHIIDPHTQVYNEEHRLVSVKAFSAVDTEVLSTVLMVLPEDRLDRVLSRYVIDGYKIYDL